MYMRGRRSGGRRRGNVHGKGVKNRLERASTFLPEGSEFPFSLDSHPDHLLLFR